MRIVAGRLKGMTLSNKISAKTRPTSDKARESIFAMLYSRINLDDMIVADLYAGTGSLGIESYSRGAQHVTFVDSDKSASHTLEANVREIIKRTNDDPKNFLVLRTPVLTFVNKTDNQHHFDIVFADPPYDDDIETDILKIIKPTGILVYETSASNLSQCEQTFVRHQRINEILVARVIGAAGILIAEAR